MRQACTVALVSLLAACGATHGEAAADGGPDSGYISGFSPPPVEPGYTRYVAPPMNVDPGQSLIYCQYVAAPFATDTDVINVTGFQSAGGHHCIAYATTFTAPVGTSRLCTNDDMLSVRYLGAIGGEATGGIAGSLPPDVVFRIPAGQMLMLNTHFIDTTPQPLVGQAVMDLKLAPPAPTDQLAAEYVNYGDGFNLTPGDPTPQTYSTSCVMQQDLNFFAFADHMHQYGYAAKTTLIHPDGGTEILADDPDWTPEMMFNPVMNKFPSPFFAVHAGDTIQTDCSWINDTTSALTAPTEMCVGFGLFISDGPEINCIDGEWPTSGDGGT